MQRDELVTSHVRPAAILSPILHNAGVTLRGAAAEAPLAAQAAEAERQLDDSGRALMMAIACFAALCRLESRLDELLGRIEFVSDDPPSIPTAAPVVAGTVVADPGTIAPVVEVPVADVPVEVPTTSIASAAAQKALSVAASVRPLMQDLGLCLPSLLDQELNAEFSLGLLTQIAAVPGLRVAANRVSRPSDCAPEVLGELPGAGIRTVYLMVAWAAAVVQARRADCDVLVVMAGWCARLTERLAHAKSRAALRSAVPSLRSRLGELLFFSAEYGVSELWIHPDADMGRALAEHELSQQPDNLRQWWATHGTAALSQFDLLVALQRKNFGVLCQRQWLAWARGVLRQRITAAGEPATAPWQTAATGRLVPSDVPAGENPAVEVPRASATFPQANSAIDANKQVLHCGHYVCFVAGASVAPEVWMILAIYTDGSVSLGRGALQTFAQAFRLSRVSKLTRGHKFFVDCALAHGVNGLAGTAGIRVDGTTLFWADAVKHHRDSEFELL